jgi:hypothetical protein
MGVRKSPGVGWRRDDGREERRTDDNTRAHEHLLALDVSSH